MNLIRSCSLLILFSILTACGVNQAALTEFSEATQKTTDVLAAASTAELVLLSDTTIAHQSCHYLGQQSFALGDTVPKPSQILIGQASVTKALSQYATALGEASDREGLAKLQTAGEGLVTNLNALSGEDASPDFGPIFSAVVLVSEVQRTQKIKEIMARVQASLFALEFRVEEDLDEVLAILAQREAAWERQARCVLQRSRTTGQGTDALFREYDAKKREWNAAEKRAAKSLAAVQALSAAHRAVILEDGELEDGLDALNAFLETLVET